jgi:Mu transposase, C-terminal
MYSNHRYAECSLTAGGVLIGGQQYTSAELAAFGRRARDGRVKVRMDPCNTSVVQVSLPGTKMFCLAYSRVAGNLNLKEITRIRRVISDRREVRRLGFLESENP